MKNLICIVDSDFLIALVMQSDLHYDQAVKIAKTLIAKKMVVLYPVTAVLEAATTIARKYNNPKLAKDLLQIYQNPDFKVVGIDQENLVKTTDLFDPNVSKHHTPFDCLILALARDQKVDFILSFDGFYQKRGFMIADDFLKAGFN